MGKSDQNPARPLIDARHEVFAQNLALGKLPAQAYVSAGFAPHRANANRTRRRPEVAARVEWLKTQAADYAQVTLGRVITEISRVAFSNIQNLFEYEIHEVEIGGKKVKQKRVKMRDLLEMPPEVAACIQSIDWDDSGRPQVKLYDRNAANFALMRHLGGLPDLPPQQLNIFNMLSPDDQRALAAILEQALRGGDPEVGQGAQALGGPGGRKAEAV